MVICAPRLASCVAAKSTPGLSRCSVRRSRKRSCVGRRIRPARSFRPFASIPSNRKLRRVRRLVVGASQALRSDRAAAAAAAPAWCPRHPTTALRPKRRQRGRARFSPRAGTGSAPGPRSSGPCASCASSGGPLTRCNRGSCALKSHAASGYLTIKGTTSSRSLHRNDQVEVEPARVPAAPGRACLANRDTPQAPSEAPRTAFSRPEGVPHPKSR